MNWIDASQYAFVDRFPLLLVAGDYRFLLEERKLSDSVPERLVVELGLTVDQSV